MKMTRVITMTALVLSVITLGSCKKTVYQQVNQVYSTVYGIEIADWQTDNSANRIFDHYVTLNVPEIDDQIVANGGVQVYLSFDGSQTPSNWDALPFTDNAGITYGTIHSKGKLTIGYGGINTGTNLPPAKIYAKVIVLDAQPLD